MHVCADSDSVHDDSTGGALSRLHAGDLLCTVGPHRVPDCVHCVRLCHQLCRHHHSWHSMSLSISSFLYYAKEEMCIPINLCTSGQYADFLGRYLHLGRST